MFRAARTSLSTTELSDELDELIAAYQEHLRAAQLEAQLKTFETILSIPFEIAEP